MLDTLRGEHSTGIASVTKEKEVIIAKTVGDPFILFEQKQTESIFKRVNRVLIGHNRHATTGKITRRNAHPFEFDSLVGVHNGTLTGKHNLDDHALFDVDSEALYHNIEKNGLEVAMGKASGAWALVWWDKEKESLNVLRNKERTLFYTWTEDKQTVFWASEMWMLSVALSRNDIKFEKIVAFDEDKHYEFSFDFQKDVLKMPEVKTVLGKKEDFFPKKATSVVSGPRGGTALTTSTARIDENYLGVSSTFKIISFFKDESGADCLLCEDEKNLDKMVRVFLHKQDHLKQKMGYHFNGNVTGARRTRSGLIVYRVEIKSPLFLKKKEAIITPEAKKEIKDDKGNIISEKDLKEFYSTCGWCNDPIDHNEEGHTYLEIEHGVICKKCSTHPEVKLFL